MGTGFCKHRKRIIVSSSGLDSAIFAAVRDNNGWIDVVFIHGLSGHPVDTWTCQESIDPRGKYWPEWLADDIPGANVYTLGYPAGLFGKFSDKEMNIYERSQNILEQLTTYDIGERPIAIVCHSLGGILAKQLIHTGLHSGNDEWSAISKKIALIVFLATPHTGSVLASLLGALVPRAASVHVELLKPENPFADQLNGSYRNHANSNRVKTVVFYEKFKTKKFSTVVSKQSADPGVAGCTPIAIDADHETICKPKDRHELVYRSTLKHISQLCKKSGPSSDSDGGSYQDAFSSDDYSTKSTRDRRDLHQKLVEANRESEFTIALEGQGRFARDYTRNGLNANIRQLHDNVLADVEQRFNAHVFGGALASGATLSETQRITQDQVIDPIAQKYKDTRGMNAKTVNDAMYYLAEMCYISWNI